MTTLEILQNRAGTAKRLQTIFAYHYDQILRECEQEIVDQVNNIYGNEKLTFFSLQGIQEYFETIHLECQEISFNRGGTVIQKQEIPEL